MLEFPWTWATAAALPAVWMGQGGGAWGEEGQGTFCSLSPSPADVS